MPHIVKQIFEQLDYQSLRNVRGAAKSWRKSIDSNNLLLIQFIKIPIILHKQDSYLHQAVRKGQSDVFEIILEREEIRKPIPYFYNQKKENRLVCQYGIFFSLAFEIGSSRIVETLVRKSEELKINLKVCLVNGDTLFIWACKNGHLNIAQMLIQKCKELDIDLSAKNKLNQSLTTVSDCYCFHCMFSLFWAKSE